MYLEKNSDKNIEKNVPGKKWKQSEQQMAGDMLKDRVLRQL